MFNFVAFFGGAGGKGLGGKSGGYWGMRMGQGAEEERDWQAMDITTFKPPLTLHREFEGNMQFT